MKETKDEKKTKRGKHSEKATVGDKIFRVLLIVAILLIAMMVYVFYVRGMMKF